MAGINSSLSRLRTLRDLFEKRLKAASGGNSSSRSSARPSRLREVINFGANPGNLRMHVYIPDSVDPSPPLVIALHGCTQTADSYDYGAGWSHLADRLGSSSSCQSSSRRTIRRTVFRGFFRPTPRAIAARPCRSAR